MASSQLSKHVAQAMENEKAKLKEVMKKNAKSNLQRKEVVAARSNEQIKAIAVCQIISDEIFQDLRYVTSHNYIGDFMTTIPRFVTPADGATFVHQGSKGAIVYALNFDDQRSPAWLLAWSKPEDPNQLSKVYVRAGPLEEFTQSDIWNGIQIGLDNATEEAQDFDPTTDAMVTARIQNSSEDVGTVGASIRIVPTLN